MAVAGDDAAWALDVDRPAASLDVAGVAVLVAAVARKDDVAADGGYGAGGGGADGVPRMALAQQIADAVFRTSTLARRGR